MVILLPPRYLIGLSYQKRVSTWRKRCGLCSVGYHDKMIWDRPSSKRSRYGRAWSNSRGYYGRTNIIPNPNSRAENLTKQNTHSSPPSESVPLPVAKPNCGRKCGLQGHHRILISYYPMQPDKPFGWLRRRAPVMGLAAMCGAMEVYSRWRDAHAVIDNDCAASFQSSCGCAARPRHLTLRFDLVSYILS